VPAPAITGFAHSGRTDREGALCRLEPPERTANREPALARDARSRTWRNAATVHLGEILVATSCELSHPELDLPPGSRGAGGELEKPGPDEPARAQHADVVQARLSLPIPTARLPVELEPVPGREIREMQRDHRTLRDRSIHCRAERRSARPLEHLRPRQEVRHLGGVFGLSSHDGGRDAVPFREQERGLGKLR
jgi:hypothetical protein